MFRIILKIRYFNRPHNKTSILQGYKKVTGQRSRLLLYLKGQYVLSTTDINADAAAAFKKNYLTKFVSTNYRRDISLITEKQTVYTGRFQKFSSRKDSVRISSWTMFGSGSLMLLGFGRISAEIGWEVLQTWVSCHDIESLRADVECRWLEVTKDSSVASRHNHRNSNHQISPRWARLYYVVFLPF